MKISISILFIACLGLLLLDCGAPKIAGGDTSETGNTFIAGKVMLPSGEGMPKTQVMLIPATYNPVLDGPIPDSYIDTTDESGHYILRIKQIAGTQYNLQAVQIFQRTRTLVLGITTVSDTLFVPDAVLENTGTLRVIFPDTTGFSNGYLYTPGTTIFKSLTNAGARVVLDSVPAAILPEVCYSIKNATAPTAIRYDVHVTSGDTTVVWNSRWNHSRKITLNTAASGANVAGSVTDFPVLIRLTAANFDFTQAKSNGDDIRFAKSDTTFLPYEIERWDPIAGLAEVWVKVDTVYGNSNTQAITVYWGNNTALGQSNSPMVFTAANGFQSVWHLGENGDTVHDATDGFFNGMNYGCTTGSGMIGNARNFTSGNYIKIPGLLKTPANLTLSAWVRSDTSHFGKNGTRGQDIVSIGDVAIIRLDCVYGIGTSGWYLNKPIVFGQDTSFVLASSGRFLANTGWHFIVYSIDTLNNIQALYIDGAQCATSNDANPVNYTGLGTDTYIGIHGNGEKIYNFTGQIDEVRVNNTSLSSNWVKLCFMNQKEQDALAKW